MINLRSLRILGYLPAGLIVTWEIEETSEDLSDFTFTVMRSGGPEGPFEPVSPPLQNTNTFFDQTGSQSERRRRFYYKIKVNKIEPPTKENLQPTDGVTLVAPPDLIATELAFRKDLELSVHGGRRIVIFPSKNSGQRCACFDDTRGRATRSECPTCFGSQFAGGFWKPISVYARITESSPSSGPAPSGKSGMLEIGAYPLLSKGDLIVEAEGNRWRIPGYDAITVQKYNRSPFRQTAGMAEVHPSAVEYSIPVDFANIESAPYWRFVKDMDI